MADGATLRRDCPPGDGQPFPGPRSAGVRSAAARSAVLVRIGLAYLR